MTRMTDAIGFVPADAGYMLCADCADMDADGSAVFGDNEVDAPMHCEDCGALIAARLTSDGVAYVADALLDYITAALFTNADGTAKHGGSASTLDAWRDEYGTSVDAMPNVYTSTGMEYGAKLVAAFDAVRERERERIAVVLVTVDGIGHKHGDDIHGQHWTESQYVGDGTPEDCCYCGATVLDGWQCLDGGEVCCSSHVVTPDDMRDVARSYATIYSSVYGASLGKLAADGIVDGIAVDAAESWLSLIVRNRHKVGNGEAWRERDKLRALVSYCDGMRSRVYADALLAIRTIANESNMPGHARIARIQLQLDAVGLPTPDGTGIGASWSQYGNADDSAMPERDTADTCKSPATVTCGICDRSWCERCDPAPAALCHYCHGLGYSTAAIAKT